METGAIFVGFMPEPTRLAVADVIDHLNPSRVVIPCVGAFATAYTIALNTKVRQIETSDMTVYSSILGYLYSGQDLEALRIKVKHKAWDGVDGLTPTEAAARYLLFLKVAQLNQRSYYHRSIADHLLLRREVLESKLTSSLSQVCQILKGRVSYEVLDMGDHMGRVDADPDVVVELDPPIYKKGYTKMFNVGHMIEWDEPDIVEFDPADLTPLMEKKLGSKATYLLTTYRNAERVPSGWRPIHAHIAKKDWVNYLWVNRFVPLSVLKRRGLTTRKVALEPWGLRDKLHKKLRVALLPIDRGTALYYRDLFMHRMGTSEAESNLAVMLGGKLLGVVGLHLRNVFMNNLPRLDLVYYPSVPSLVYPNINRLMLKLLLARPSKEFMERVLLHAPNNRVEVVHTPVTSSHPEVKSHRGIFEAVKVERRKDGMFQIQYEGPFTDHTYKQVIVHYLAEVRKREKQRKAQGHEES